VNQKKIQKEYWVKEMYSIAGLTIRIEEETIEKKTLVFSL